MEDIYKIAANGGISDAELKDALKASLAGRTLQKVLILPPDFTRFHSQAGKITGIYYHLLTERGVQTDIMPALGTHEPVSKEQWEIMFKGIPYETMTGGMMWSKSAKYRQAIWKKSQMASGMNRSAWRSTAA